MLLGLLGHQIRNDLEEHAENTLVFFFFSLVFYIQPLKCVWR